MMNGFYRLRRWWFVAFALGSAVLFLVGTLILPMQSPDEGTHLIRAYTVSKGRWLAVTPNEKMTGYVVDRPFLQYGLAGTYEWLQGPRRLTEQRLSELAAMTWEPDGSETFFELPGAAYYAPLVYLPHTLGMAAGRWLGLTIDTSVAWASLLASAMTAVLVVAAVAVWRPPVMVLGLLLLPMTVSQAASPTIDGITDMRATTIDGLQGRYFLLPAMMVAFGVFWGRPPTVLAAAGGQRLAATWLPVLATAVFAVTCLVVLSDVLNNHFHPLLAS